MSDSWIKLYVDFMQLLHLNQKKQIPFFNITYLESDANYTNVYTVSNTKILSSYTIGVLYQKLDQKRFFRANRRLVFNLKFVSEIWHEGAHVYVILRSGKRIEFSRRRSSHFKKFMKSNHGFKIPYRYPSKHTTGTSTLISKDFALYYKEDAAEKNFYESPQ